jgi:hypothetical protein
MQFASVTRHKAGLRKSTPNPGRKFDFIEFACEGWKVEKLTKPQRMPGVIENVSGMSPNDKEARNRVV